MGSSGGVWGALGGGALGGGALGGGALGGGAAIFDASWLLSWYGNAIICQSRDHASHGMKRNEGEGGEEGRLGGRGKGDGLGRRGCLGPEASS